MAGSGGGEAVSGPGTVVCMGRGQAAMHLPPGPKRDFTSHVTTVCGSSAVDLPTGCALAWGLCLSAPTSPEMY